MIQMFIHDLLKTTTLRFDKETEANFADYLVRAACSQAANKP
jgi:hypothetical protein